MAALKNELKIDPFFTQGTRLFSYNQASDFNALPANTRALFHALIDAERSEATRAFGAKIAFAHAREVNTVRKCLLGAHGDWRIIAIRRSDKLATIGSMIVAKKTDLYHLGKGESREHCMKVRLKPLELEYEVLNLCEIEQAQTLLGNDFKCIFITYEELLRETKSLMAQLCKFLELDTPTTDITLPMKKVLPKPQDYIVGYSEHIERVKETEKAFKAGKLNTQSDRYKPLLRKRRFTRLNRYYLEKVKRRFTS